MEQQPHGYFIISLDFELFWGMADVTTIDAYGKNVRGVRSALPRMLKLFSSYGIHATWATVGMLMCRNKDELLSLLPPHNLRPTYTNPRMSAYHHIEHDGVGRDEADDPYHYGKTLVTLVLETPNQEIENHTFSHYYASDGERNPPHVLARDLQAHKTISSTYGVTTSSIVFPRNQVSDEALRVCREHSMTSYRGNEDHFLYRARKTGENSLFVRALRLLDHYVNISGHHTYPLPQTGTHGMVNIPASRFFRPYMKSLAFLEPLRMRRIKRAMTHAAKHGEIFHLWWHPHNFGVNQEENFKNLTEILEHYKKLHTEYGMESLSMGEMARQISAPTA